MDSLLFLACVVVCLAWTGRNPSSAKTVCTILVFTGVAVGYDFYVASTLDMMPSQMFKQAAEQIVHEMASMGVVEQDSLAQLDQSAFVFDCWIALETIAATVYVVIGMCVRWIYERVRRINTWKPFSRVDLSAWWATPLIIAIVLYIMMVMMQESADEGMRALVLSVFMVSLIPLFFQGAAVGKGLMNNMGVNFAWQLCLGILALMLMVPVLVFPILGLIDIWANFRRLDRADSKPRNKPSD